MFKDLLITQSLRELWFLKIQKLLFRIFEQEQFPKIQILSWQSKNLFEFGS